MNSAAKTALLLDNTQLGPSAVHVTAAHNLDDIAGPNATSASEAADEHEHNLAQEDKPRSRIVAEYLAHGYVLSDQALQKAIALDSKHGISSRFTTVLNNFDKKYHATERAKGLDESYKISDKAVSGWRGLNSYFEKALDTPTGRRIREFYIKSDKQVRDIHNEARRLADLKSGKISPQTTGEKPAEGSTEPVTAGGAAGADVAPTGAPTGDPNAPTKV